MQEIPYKSLIKEYDNQILKNDKNQFILKPIKLIPSFSSTFNIEKNFINKEFITADNHKVPLLIRKIHSNLKNNDYFFLKKKLEFNEKTVFVCENCALDLANKIEIYNKIKQKEFSLQKNNLVKKDEIITNTRKEICKIHENFVKSQIKFTKSYSFNCTKNEEFLIPNKIIEKNKNVANINKFNLKYTQNEVVKKYLNMIDLTKYDNSLKQRITLGNNKNDPSMEDRIMLVNCSKSLEKTKIYHKINKKIRDRKKNLSSTLMSTPQRNSFDNV